MSLKLAIKSLVGDIESTSVQFYLFNLSCIGEAVILFVFSITNYLSGYPLLALYAIVPGEFLTILAFVLARRRRDYRPFVFILWLLLFLLSAPTWILLAGSAGSTIYPIFGYMIVLLILSSDKWRLVLLGVVLAYVAALLGIEAAWPGLIGQYVSQSARFQDVASTILLCLLFPGVVVSFYITNYNKTAERLRVEKARVERLIRGIQRYLPSQLVQMIARDDGVLVTAPQRKRITVFFSDIENFTPTTDAMQPEDLTVLLNEYQTEMTSIATRHGGTIDKFVGDAMMVLFGAPVGKDERSDAVACLKMAVEMQQRMADLSKKWYEAGTERPLRIRVGINTGVATVGDFGANDRLSYTAIGGEVNLAARLQTLCAPGGIVISHATWGLVKDEFACTQRAEKVLVKGISREVTVYDVQV